MTTTIACLSPYTEDLVRELAGTSDISVLLVPEPPAPDAVREAVREADIVISDNRHKHRLDRATLAAMTRCRLIQQPAVGFDVIDHRAAAELGIPVANSMSYNRESVADLVIMGILNLIRHGARADRAMRAGQWTGMNGASLEGRELGALTVGIIGMGNIGYAVATRLRAFGCSLLFNDIAARGLSGVPAVSLGELLEQADVVTVHVPLDRETRGLIGAEELKRMRRGAFLVNASRGPVVDEAALVEALESGHLGGAALDVFETEPLSKESPLRQMENVFLTPHIGGNTKEAKEKSLESVAINVRRVLAGERPLNVVNGI